VILFIRYVGGVAILTCLAILVLFGFSMAAMTKEEKALFQHHPSDWLIYFGLLLVLACMFIAVVG
jgi:protein-S-isoprenylcysteine O-methyltransferase Ste14